MQIKDIQFLSVIYLFILLYKKHSSIKLNSNSINCKIKIVILIYNVK